jgi:hypothetical protein
MSLKQPLAMLDMFSHCSLMMTMVDRVEARRLSDILAGSPMWARLALTAADPRMRERAADTMAAVILSKLAEPEPPVRDEAQMMLPML